jgi:hypothetical protein
MNDKLAENKVLLNVLTNEMEELSLQRERALRMLERARERRRLAAQEETTAFRWWAHTNYQLQVLERHARELK